MADRQIKISVDIVSGSGGTTKIKGTLNEIDNEVKRINQSMSADAKRTQKFIADSTKARVNEEIREEKRLERDRKKIANDFISSIKRVENESKSSASRMSSAFKGGFLGGLTGALSAQLAQLPGMLKSTLDEMVSIAAERQNALKGLESVSIFKGIDTASSQDAVKNLRLVKTGMIDVADATTSLKNLLLTGFSLPEAVKLMEAFSDSAAFGKQSALSYGDAIRGATEGIKNQNSVLVDNAGVTKNLSVILKEAGKSEKDLMNVTTDASVRQALYNGLIKETSAFTGDADKLTQGWTGSTAALETAQKNLYAAMGDIITRNPEMNALIHVLTAELNSNTKELIGNESQTKSTFGTWVTWTAKAGISLANFADDAQADIKAVQNALATLVLSLGSGVTAIVGGVIGLINKSFILPVNTLITSVQNNPFLIKVLGEAGTSAMSSVQIPEIPNPVWDMAKQLDRAAQLTSKGITNTDAKKRGAQRWQMFDEELRRNPQPSRTTNDSRISTDSRPPTPSTAGHAGGGSSSGGGRIKASGTKELSPRAKAIVAGADKLGISPIDYATVMLYETAGTLNPWQKGPTTKWGTHRGTLQYGEPQARQYGVHQGQSFFAQVTGSNVRYLQDRGIKPGASLLDIYKAVNGGNVNASASASDGYGTVASHVAKMIRDRRPEAEKLLQGAVGGRRENIADEVQQMMANRSESLTKADHDKFLSQIIAAYKAAGLIPTGELLDEIHARMVDEMKRSGVSTFSSSKEATQDMFGLTVRSGIQDSFIGQRAETQFKVNPSMESLKEILGQLDDEQFNLNEHTREEILLRNIQLGQYPELVGGAKELAIAKARETDVLIKKKESDKEALDALEKYRDEQRRVFEDTKDFFGNKLEALMGGGFKGLWKSILQDMKRSFIDKASSMLAGLFSGAKNPQNGQSQQSGGGFANIFSSLFGGGGGAGQGPGGTPNFNPGSNFAQTSGGSGFSLSNLFGGRGINPTTGSGSGPYDFLNTGHLPGVPGSPSESGKGGIMEMLTGMGGMFGPRKNLLSGKMSGLGGKMGGIGDIAAMAGGLIGGRWGNVLSMAGTGMSIGSMFGPWGAAIGAGAGALIGLFMGGDKSIKKLKAAALSTYGITVKDKEVLNSLKQIGEQYFGKGKAGENATQVVGLDESKNILRNYASATGQNSEKIDMMSHSDVDWKGNQFSNSKFGGFRARGGSVYPGMSYVVGERRPEMFTPNVAGHISQSLPATNGMSSVQMQVVLGQLEETIHMLTSRIESMPAGQVVAMGAKERPDAIVRAYESEMAADPRNVTNNSRVQGQMI